MRQPQSADGVGEQSQDQRRDRSQDRPDVGDQLHHPIEDTERERVLAPVREDAEHAEQVQRDPGRGAHDHAEQELSADIARHGVLGQARIVVGRSAVAGGHRLAHQPADRLAVDEHVDRQHEHEHQIHERFGHFGEQSAAEGGEFRGAFGDLVLQRLQRRLALADEFGVDAVFVQFSLKARDLAVGFVDDMREIVRERAHLI